MNQTNLSRTQQRGGLLLACVVIVALALSACGSNGPSIAHLNGNQPSRSSGSSSSPGGGSLSSGSPGGGAHAEAQIQMAGLSGSSALKFATCIRAHGVPGFPDPNAQGVFSMSGSAASIPQSAQFQRASKTCRSLLHLHVAPPSPAAQAKGLAQLLKYSQCMRSHGITNFPDPTTAGGGVSLRVHAGPGGVDPSSPIFQHAQKACASLQPGGPGASP
jgi:hypothetical protein